MLAKSHVLSATIIAVPMLGMIEEKEALIFLISVVIGSLFPDLDEPGSFLSRRVKIVSVVLSMFTKHRGVTHTFIALSVYSLAFAVLNYYYPLIPVILIGFILGNVIHFLGDMSTKESGLKLLYPFSNKKYHVLPKKIRVKTGSNIEKYLVIPTFGTILVVELYFYIGTLSLNISV